MEHLPTELIGNIISRLGPARDVVIASTTFNSKSLYLKHYYKARGYRVYQFQWTSLTEFILEADGLEGLHLKDCVVVLFKLVGKVTLKQCKIDDVSSIHFDIGETLENLLVIDINNFTIIWPKFYQMISRSSKLRRLQLWSVFFDDNNEIVDLETFAVCFPQLSHLSLCLRDGVLHYGLPGSSQLENVTEMELG
ncbi:F-box/LRR-repeat protein [Vitis vinifera]|uniref:F-box/LRR-repeat protein n=1 Tax=Vitis vinifera TaxID=29760 RepID=A0A438HRA4_VITVI|nr:F-box/LRR-repeat protein [Vitis vinifera]